MIRFLMPRNPGRAIRLPVALTGLLLLVWSGCSVWKAKPVIAPDENRLENILAMIRHHDARLDRLKGRGRMVIDLPEQSMTLDAHVIVDRPDTFYIRLEALFGLDVGWLFVVKDKYTFYSPMQNTWASGSTDSLRMGPLPDFFIDSHAVLGAFAGLALVNNLENMHITREGKDLILSGTTELGAQKHWVDRGRGIIIRSEQYDTTGQVLVRTSYERFSKLNGVFVPRTIRLQRPGQRQGVTMFYEQLQVNEKLSAKDIKIKIPRNARRVSW